MQPQPTHIHHDEQMLDSHPRGAVFDKAALIACIQACLDCAAACTSCADACSAENDAKILARCIRLNADCADVCLATSRVVARQTEPDPGLIRAVLDACIAACTACAAECERHAAHM